MILFTNACVADANFDIAANSESLSQKDKPTNAMD